MENGIDWDPYTDRIIITNKTYPEYSPKYGYIVCVAGINEDGQWRRLYPVPYDLWSDWKNRHLAFSKWDMIEVRIQKQEKNKDPRKESYKLLNPYELKIVRKIKDWGVRREIVDRYIMSGMNELNENKFSDRHRGFWNSLGIIKPRRIIDFIERHRNETEDAYKRVADVQMRMSAGLGMSAPRHPDPIGRLVGFKFECFDIGCKGHNLMCNDWEVCQLYRKVGFDKTRDKMMSIAADRDLYLMLGTVHPYWVFINVGVFYPPKQNILTTIPA